MPPRIYWLALPTVMFALSPVLAGSFEVAEDDDGFTVKLDGQLFTRYLKRSGTKPILWPIIGPTGVPVTRGYPMQAAIGSERDDHRHHRSLWFTHGTVNDSDFWLEGRGNSGSIVHRQLVRAEGGSTATLETRNAWLDHHGKEICQDVRKLQFGLDGDARYIDFDITITAGDQPVTFGDTKEGTFAMRVAGTMKVDTKPGGTIVNEHGQTNRDAWGQSAAWVDYHGPVAGQTVGIAILNHPKSFRFPTYWHVRTYGLFAANVFGRHDFQRDNSLNASHTLQPAESMTFYYRVLLHRGDHKQAKVAEAYDRYAALEK